MKIRYIIQDKKTLQLYERIYDFSIIEKLGIYQKINEDEERIISRDKSISVYDINKNLLFNSDIIEFQETNGLLKKTIVQFITQFDFIGYAVFRNRRRFIILNRKNVTEYKIKKIGNVFINPELAPDNLKKIFFKTKDDILKKIPTVLGGNIHA